MPPPGAPGRAASRLAAVEQLRELLRRKGVGAAVLPAEAEASDPTAAAEARPEPDHPLAGLRAGTLAVLSGPRSSGKTSLALGLLAEASRRGELAAVVDGTGWIFPPSLALLGADLERLLFLRARAGLAVWAAEQVLRSGVFAAVALVEPGARVDQPALRRLQLAAERSGARALLVSREPVPSSGLAWARLEAAPVPPRSTARLAETARCPVASPPRSCRARLVRRGGEARVYELDPGPRPPLEGGG